MVWLFNEERVGKTVTGQLRVIEARVQREVRKMVMVASISIVVMVIMHLAVITKSL